ncbi:MAG: hypothetical protein BGO76_01790 [Caedibacter sp. 38-128]|nr:trypsin-like serine protease [Holosporales bacterium]OJX05146.1 MAG: hypothetical protein BGO76_01790 [Caedibacter sp. 38-128]
MQRLASIIAGITLTLTPAAFSSESKEQGDKVYKTQSSIVADDTQPISSPLFPVHDAHLMLDPDTTFQGISKENETDATIEARYNADKDLYYREFDSIEQAERLNKSYYGHEKILGDKDRRECLGRRVYEKDWNCHFYLEIIYNNVHGKCKTYYASGTLIRPNVLLTAAHNLYDERDGGYPDRIDCFAACYDMDVLAEATVFPIQNPESVFVPQQYINTKARGSDIAYIRFSEEDVSLFNTKNLTVATPYSSFKKLPVERLTLYVTGYPGKRAAYTMGASGSLIKRQADNTLQYDIDTEKGQSGSGIWFKNKDIIYCVGVHGYAGDKEKSFNIGILFNDEIINALKRIDSKQ